MRRLLLCDLNVFVILCKEKNVKKIGQFIGKNISRTAKAISFNFDMWSSVYVRQKYINLVEIGAGVLGIQNAEFGKFVVPVNC